MTHVRTHPHEVGAFLRFVPGRRDTYEGLAPYWFLSHLLFNKFDGYSGEIETTVDGEPWTVELTYWKTGIAPLDEHNVGGNALYGFNVHGEGPGEAKADFQIEPRFDGMKHRDDGESLSIPWDSESGGIEVQTQSSNIEPGRLPQLLRDFVAVLCDVADVHWNADYLTGVEPDSKLYAYERYVRIDREVARALIQQDGPFWSIFHLLGSKEGTKLSFDVDNEDIEGHLWQLRLLRSAATQLIDTHQFGKQLKHYHMKEPEAQTGALRHPKVGVLVNKSLNDGEALDWSQRSEARREIEEMLVNCLDWADVGADPDAGHFVEDAHFSPVASEQRIGRFDDPTPQLEAEQESLLIRTMVDLSDGATELLEEVATDGGTHYEEAADDLGVSTSSIYRWLSELGDLVRNDNGEISLVSEHLEEEVTAIAKRAENAVKSGAERICRLVDQQRDADGSALQRWMHKYGGDIDLEEGEISIDVVLTTLRGYDEPRVSEVLEEARTAWQRAGRDLRKIDRMRFSAQTLYSGTVSGRVRKWTS